MGYTFGILWHSNSPAPCEQGEGLGYTFGIPWHSHAPPRCGIESSVQWCWPGALLVYTSSHIIVQAIF